MLYKKINRFIENWRKYQEKQGNTVAAAPELDGDGTDYNPSPMAGLGPGASRFLNLKKAVILDFGSNVHVVNKYLEDRIVERRPSGGVQMAAVTQIIDVKEIVTVKLYPQLDGRNQPLHYMMSISFQSS